MTLPEAEILGARILVVNDQPEQVLLLEHVLESAGYTAVTSALQEQQVVDLHHRHDFDLVLLDLNTAQMDGLRVIAALRGDPGGEVLPVIVIAARPGQPQQALQHGAQDYISPPFDPLEVKSRIRNLVELRLMHRRLEQHNRVLEDTVRMRTAELRESEARYRHLTELAADWHWEQDEQGSYTKLHGPVLQMLGLPSGTEPPEPGWDQPDRAALRAAIAARRPFIDFPFTRVSAEGFRQRYRVSGEPMFSASCRYVGYRGVGMETTHHVDLPPAAPAPPGSAGPAA